MQNSFPVRCGLCLQMTDRTKTLSVHRDDVDFAQRKRFFLDGHTYEFAANDEKTRYMPEWKYVTDPDNPRRVVAVPDYTGKMKLERVNVRNVKSVPFPEISICPACQDDPAVRQATQKWRKQCEIAGRHTGLATDTFLRDKTGNPTAPTKTFARGQVVPN